MTSLEDSRVRVVAVLSHESSNSIRANDGSIPGFLKLLTAGILNSQGCSFASKPVAAEVSISKYHVYLDTAVEKIADCFHGACTLDIGGASEGAGDSGRRGRIINGHAQRFQDPELREEAIHIWLRRWVSMWVSDVIPAKL